MCSSDLFPSESYMCTWASSEAEKSRRGSVGEYTRDLTGMEWPSKWCKNLARATSKTEMVPSIEPQASRLPSRLQATDRTNFLLPLLSEGLGPSGRGIGRVATGDHVAVSQSLIDALPPPATARVDP